MRVLVCGGRHYADRKTLWQVLDNWHNARRIDVVIQGGAPGADRLAGVWSKNRGVLCLTYQADWSLGPRAGPLRNAQMLAEGQPDVVLAFPGDRGTDDMRKQARAAGVRVVEPVQEALPGLFTRRTAFAG